jgi:glycosyltransferase involved in cell wall biosynthesis
MKKINAPLVSIVILTYNQEKTISQTLDSVLNQNIDFPVEVIVGEDCSTDSTREICLEYYNKYPQVIRLILHEKNQGLLCNYKSVIESCRGKYIAGCAGDDYWHDPNKLKLQVDFLENNPDYGLVHTNIDMLYVRNNEIKKAKRSNIPEGYVYENLMGRNFISAPTVMFKRDLILRYVSLDEYITQGFMMEDYPMWLEFSQHTKFFYLDISTVTYRQHTNSVSHSVSYEKTIAFAENIYKIRKYFHSKYPPDNVSMIKMAEEQYYITCWSIALRFNIRNDIVTYSKYLPNKTIKQKIRNKLLQFRLMFLIYNYVVTRLC